MQTGLLIFFQAANGQGVNVAQQLPSSQSQIATSQRQINNANPNIQQYKDLLKSSQENYDLLLQNFTNYRWVAFVLNENWAKTYKYNIKTIWKNWNEFKSILLLFSMIQMQKIILPYCWILRFRTATIYR